MCRTAFAAAVDWSETWIQGLIGFHVLAWFFVLFFRKNMTFQSVTFLLICVVVSTPFLHPPEPFGRPWER